MMTEQKHREVQAQVDVVTLCGDELRTAIARQVSYGSRFIFLIEEGKSSMFVLREAQRASEDATHEVGVAMRALRIAQKELKQIEAGWW
jgi:hypothetical protein